MNKLFIRKSVALRPKAMTYILLMCLFVQRLLGANFTLEMFGAQGDGVTDDTQPFLNCIAAMKANGQDNTLTLGTRKVYRVGRQGLVGNSKVPQVTGEAKFYDFTKKITIEGNNATLKLNQNLKMGSFNPSTGAVFNPPNYPQEHFTDWSYRAHLPSVLRFVSCSEVVVNNINIDGTLNQTIVGGFWGDGGYQVQAYGVYFFNCDKVSMTNAWIYNCGSDGVLNTQTGPSLVREDDNTKYWPDRSGKYAPVTYTNVHSYWNTRDGFTWEGGYGYYMDGCSAKYNGMNVYGTPPAAGLNTESHFSTTGYHAPNINGDIKNSVFTNNRSGGYLCWTTSATSWVVFRNCVFQSDGWYGSIVMEDQHSFYNCTFYGTQYWQKDSNTDWHGIYAQDCIFTDVPTATFPEITTVDSTLLYGGGKNMRFWRNQFIPSKVMVFSLSTGNTSKRMFMDYATIRFSGTQSIIGSIGIAGYIMNSNISNVSIGSDANFNTTSTIYASDTNVGLNVKVEPNSKVGWNSNFGAVTLGYYP